MNDLGSAAGLMESGDSTAAGEPTGDGATATYEAADTGGDEDGSAPAHGEGPSAHVAVEATNEGGATTGGRPRGQQAPGAAARSALDPSKDIEDAVRIHMRELLDWARQRVLPEDGSARATKRRKRTSAAPAENEYTYTTVSTAVRALYEDMEDWQHSVPLSTRRKGWRPGQFDSFRLREVERFALECGGGGLSLQGIEKLWRLLDTWDGTRPGMPIDGGHNDSIRDTFKSVNAMKDAIRDDVDDAVLGAGWLKCDLSVDGMKHTVFFRPVLQVVLDMLKSGQEVRLWSGDTGPAEPTNKRESPLDGDAFRLNEAALMEEMKDDACFVLGLHVYSDASQLSWSGGKSVFSSEDCVVPVCADRRRVPYLFPAPVCGLLRGTGVCYLVRSGD